MKFNRMFVDLWNLFKLYYSPNCKTQEEEDAWWQAFINDAQEFSKKYDMMPFARALVMCLQDEMTRKFRILKGENENEIKN